MAKASRRRVHPRQRPVSSTRMVARPLLSRTDRSTGPSRPPPPRRRHRPLRCQRRPPPAPLAAGHSFALPTHCHSGELLRSSHTPPALTDHFLWPEFSSLKIWSALLSDAVVERSDRSPRRHTPESMYTGRRAPLPARMSS